MAMLELKRLRKTYPGGVDALHEIDFTIETGEMIVVVGPSGCGKSTLLRMLAGLETITGGDLNIDGQRVNDREPAERDIAMVFQNYALYPHMTVFDNMAYSLRNQRTPKAEIDQRVRDTARLLGIDMLLDRNPRQLSGGQRQRVAMGRAVVRKPRVFLFDEPLSNLDAGLRVQMRQEIRRLQKRLGVTSVYVTHDQVEAMTLADRLVVMNKGRVEQIGTPMDLFTTPATRFVAGFIGSPAMNFLDLAPDQAAPWLPDRVSIADEHRKAPLTVGIRPEQVTVSRAADATLQGEVELVEPLGAESLVHVRLAEQAQTLVARVPGLSDLALGERVGVVFGGTVHLFGADGSRVADASPRRAPHQWAADL